ncbi:MAG: hypothetical protein WB607_00570 [Candidatus Acidiferrum sp.]
MKRSKGVRSGRRSLATLSGDSAKARIAYQDFFTKWKDADPDIPILKEAKVESRSCNSEKAYLRPWSFASQERLNYFGGA